MQDYRTRRSDVALQRTPPFYASEAAARAIARYSTGVNEDVVGWGYSIAGIVLLQASTDRSTIAPLK